MNRDLRTDLAKIAIVFLALYGFAQLMKPPIDDKRKTLEEMCELVQGLEEKHHFLDYSDAGFDQRLEEELVEPEMSQAEKNEEEKEISWLRDIALDALENPEPRDPALEAKYKRLSVKYDRKRLINLCSNFLWVG